MTTGTSERSPVGPTPAGREGPEVTETMTPNTDTIGRHRSDRRRRAAGHGRLRGRRRSQSALIPAIAVAPESSPTRSASTSGLVAADPGGESGALPIVVGLVLIVIIFQIQNSNFLTAGNIVNLLVQAAVFILLGLAETFALLLSEIDLSVGYVAAVGAFIIAELMARPTTGRGGRRSSSGSLATAAIGALQGTLITRLRLPSFVVTLAGLLGWQGVMICIADIDKAAVGGVIRIATTNVGLQAGQRQHDPTAELDPARRHPGRLRAVRLVPSRRPAPAGRA